MENVQVKRYEIGNMFDSQALLFVLSGDNPPTYMDDYETDLEVTKIIIDWIKENKNNSEIKELEEFVLSAIECSSLDDWCELLMDSQEPLDYSFE